MMNDLTDTIKEFWVGIQNILISNLCIVGFFFLIGFFSKINYLDHLITHDIIVSTVFLYVVFVLVPIYCIIDWHNKNSDKELTKQWWFKGFNIIIRPVGAFYLSILISNLIIKCFMATGGYNLLLLLYIVWTQILLITFPKYSYKADNNAMKCRGFLLVSTLLILAIPFIKGCIILSNYLTYFIHNVL